MAITLSVNDSPLAGTEGKKLTSTMIRERLMAENEGNVAIRVSETAGKDAFEVAGRGELQLGVLIETMRREGFEMSVSRPRVLLRKTEDGQTEEPYEEVIADVDEEFTGVVVEKMSMRKAEMVDMRPSGGGKTRITFIAPSRGLIGYQGQFLTDTRGTGVLNRLFHSYGPYKGEIAGRRNGALISTDKGEAVAYAIFNLQDRGTMFINPGDKVYQGMIVGEHSRDNDLDINVLKGKQLTNIRAAGKDDALILTPPRKMSMEDMISYINDDELLEVTPQSLRLRKKHLTPNERTQAKKRVS
jgi:GTP-binding protein